MCAARWRVSYCREVAGFAGMKWLAECSAEALGDALWRSEAGIPLADHRTPPEWVEDLAARFGALGIAP